MLEPEVGKAQGLLNQVVAETDKATKERRVLSAAQSKRKAKARAKRKHTKR